MVHENVAREVCGDTGEPDTHPLSACSHICELSRSARAQNDHKNVTQVTLVVRKHSKLVFVGTLEDILLAFELLDAPERVAVLGR